MFDNRHDASMRLNGTIIRYKNIPYYIRGVEESWIEAIDGNILVLLASPCSNTTAISKIPLSDPDINISSPPLGYIRLSNYTWSYAVRMPERKQAQGMVPDRIHVRDHKDGGQLRRLRGDVSIKAIGECISGKYQTSADYEKHLKELPPYGWSVGLSRNIAVDYDRLYYKAHVIGSIEHKDGVHYVTITSSLFNKFTFDMEVLGENWIIVA